MNVPGNNSNDRQPHCLNLLVIWSDLWQKLCRLYQGVFVSKNILAFDN